MNESSTTPVPFGDRLAEACEAKQSHVCVGLDPRWGNLPSAITEGIDPANPAASAGAIQCYCQEVIDAVAPHTAIVKPQAAFFELLGPDGMQALAGIIQHAQRAGLLVLLDGKRGDIGSTAEGYAEAYLNPNGPWKCDALTVNPFLGEDTWQPFVKAARENGTGIFVLVKTSNPGSGFIQDLKCDDATIYSRIAAEVQRHASDSQGHSSFGSVGAVVGATYPEQLAQLREQMANAWILIPGFGAQGGTAETVLPGFMNPSGENDRRTGAIVNSSRGIIFAYQQARYAGMAWQDAVAQAAHEMQQQLP